MAESRMAELANQLLVSARAGKLDWHEGVSRSSYDVDFPDVSLSIRELKGGLFALALINDEGDEIESLEYDRGEPLGAMLQEIYNIARRQSLDIEENIDKAIDYLRRA